MSQIDPTVRYLIVCEDVQVEEDNPRRISLVGLIHAIRVVDDLPFPLLYRELCVFVELTECRGPADGFVEIIHADSGKSMFRTRTRTLQLGSDPLEVFAVSFRIRNCLFQSSGLYWIQFWYNGRILAQQPLLVR